MVPVLTIVSTRYAFSQKIATGMNIFFILGRRSCPGASLLYRNILVAYILLLVIITATSCLGKDSQVVHTGLGQALAVSFLRHTVSRGKEGGNS